MDPIDEADRELIARAEETLRAHFDPRTHTTGTALRTADGGVYTAVSLKADTPSADVHAEPIAVARAKLDGATDFDTVVAVQFRDEGSPDETRVVSACGVCREVLLRQAPEVSIIVEHDGELVKRVVSELLPD